MKSTSSRGRVVRHRRGDRAPALGGLARALARLAPGALALAVQAADPAPDNWLPEGRYPAFVRTLDVNVESFSTLHAEVLVGRLKVRWTAPEAESPKTNVTLYVSADAPGRWPARDWRPVPMVKAGERWEAAVPVDRVDVPLVYFVAVGTFEPEKPLHGQPGPERVSPLRVARPDRLGMGGASRVFWPFLDGFEEHLAGWRIVSDAAQGFSMERSASPHNGKNALTLFVPEGKGSGTIATTRLRGWQVAQQNATGFSLWLRSDQPNARVRFTLFSHASMDSPRTAPCRRLMTIDETWTRIDVAFRDFRGVVPGQIDLLAVELIGEGPVRFWVDDLQLLGRWALE